MTGKIQCKQTDLEDMGELGHGTCGQVFTMLHKQTGKIMAVKVRQIIAWGSFD